MFVTQPPWSSGSLQSAQVLWATCLASKRHKSSRARVHLYCIVLYCALYKLPKARQYILCLVAKGKRQKANSIINGFIVFEKFICVCQSTINITNKNFN